MPRIEIDPVVFGGTYDAENWRVLQERWDDLRAQLHGVPVPSRLAGDDEEARLLIEEISSMAPLNDREEMVNLVMECVDIEVAYQTVIDAKRDLGPVG